MTRPDGTEKTLELLRELPAEVTLEQVGQMVVAFPLAAATATWLSNINLNSILMTTAGSILIGGSIYMMSAEDPATRVAIAPLTEPATLEETVIEPMLEVPAVVLEIPSAQPVPEPVAEAIPEEKPEAPSSAPANEALVVVLGEPEAPPAANVLRIPGSSRTFDLKDFTAVSVHGSLDVTVEQGSFSVTATGEEAPLEGLRLVVDKGTLVIDMGQVKPHDDDHKKNSCASGVKVMVRMPQLIRAELMGSGDVRVGAFTGSGELDVELHGSGDLRVDGFTGIDKLNIDLAGSGDIICDATSVAGSTRIHLAGSGDIRVAGSTGDIDIHVQGSGDVYANDMHAGNAVVEVQGSGDAYVHCSGNLKEEVHGSGDIHVSGSAGVNRP